MAILEDGMGSPMMEALPEEDDVFEEDEGEGEDASEDEDAFLERLQSERNARLASASAKRPESARAPRPESARHPNGSSNATATATARRMTGRSGCGDGDVDGGLESPRPGAAPSSSGRSVVGGGGGGGVGYRNGSNTGRPVSAVRTSRGGGGFTSARGRLTHHHHEFQPYDPHDPLDADPLNGGGGGNGNGGGAYGVPPRRQQHNRRASSLEKGSNSPASTSGKLSQSPYALGSGGGVRGSSARSNRGGVAGTTGDDVLGRSTAGSSGSGGGGRVSTKGGGGFQGFQGFGGSTNNFASTGGFSTGRSRASGGGGGKAPEASAPLEWWPKDSRRERERARKAFDSTPAPISYPAFAEPKTPAPARSGNRAWQSSSSPSDGNDNAKLSDISRVRAVAVYGGGGGAVMARALNGVPPPLLSPVLGAAAGGAAGAGAGRRPQSAFASLNARATATGGARPTSATGARPTSAVRGGNRPQTAGSGTLRDIPEATKKIAAENPPPWKQPPAEQRKIGNNLTSTSPSAGAASASAVHLKNAVYEKHARADAPAYDALKPMFGPGHRSQRAGAYEEIGKSGLLQARHGTTMKEVLAEQRRARVVIGLRAVLALGSNRGGSGGGGGGGRRNSGGGGGGKSGDGRKGGDGESMLTETELDTRSSEDAGEDEEEEDVLAELDAQAEEGGAESADGADAADGDESETPRAEVVADEEAAEVDAEGVDK
jgi:hypothetical protein